MTEVIIDWFKIIEIYDQNTECFFLFLAFLNDSSVIRAKERRLHIPVKGSVVTSFIILNSSSTISAKSLSNKKSSLVNTLGSVSIIHIVPAISPSGSLTGCPA